MKRIGNEKKHDGREKVEINKLETQGKAIWFCMKRRGRQRGGGGGKKVYVKAKDKIGG